MKKTNKFLLHTALLVKISFTSLAKHLPNLRYGIMTVEVKIIN